MAGQDLPPAPHEFAREFFRTQGVEQRRTDLYAIQGNQFQPYDPVWTTTGAAPSIGNGGIAGFYCLHDGLVELNGIMVFNTTTSFGTGEWRISLPTGLVSRTLSLLSQNVGYHQGCALGTSNGTTYVLQLWCPPTSSVLRVIFPGSGVPASVTNTAPGLWQQATTNWLSWNISLQLAA